ncbi:hypothetical protein Ga0100231_002145 [Opitutaceae bacterium TAV4]|nr:hypothetical protein Ga0100231_002145 [Opitutaceae bacterium TAV4]RRK01763.1 hypothetical protein Ga0100230_000340 [Opitutaceae bacterium TAV3]
MLSIPGNHRIAPLARHALTRHLLACALAAALPGTASLRAQVELWRNGQQHPPLFVTIQSAVDAAQPGDTLRIRPGTYHENIRITGKHAPADNPITLEPAADKHTHNATVILDGADPELQRATPAVPLTRWTPLPDPTQGWQATVPWTWTTRESRALLTWASHADDRLIAAHHNEAFFLRAPRGDALWRTGTTVRLRLADGRDPNTVPLNIGTAEGIIQLTDSTGWNIRGLTLRNAGVAGVHLNGSGVSDIILQDLVIRTAFRGITTEEIKSLSRRITIRRCRIQNFWNFDWEWVNGYRDAASASDEEVAPVRGHGIRLKAEDSEVSHCEIAGQWDGMMIQGRNIRVHDNLVHHTYDDMIELESGRSTDIHFYDNVGFKLFVGISVVSNRPGPIYIYRNRIQTTDTIRREGDTRRYGYPIKMGNDWGPGARGIYIYQNTFVSDGRSLFVATKPPRYRPENWRDIAFVNNIFQRNRLARPVGLEGMGPAANNIRWEGNLFTWDADLARLAELDPAYATSGIVADPRLTAPAASPFDARLSTPDSPARAAGSLLALESNWPDSYPKPNDKSKPDIGAIPYGVEPHTAGPGGDLYWPWSKN